MFPSIPSQLKAHATTYPEKKAITEISCNGSRSLTFSNLIRSAHQLCQHLKPHGEAKRHALLAGNTLECHVFYLACALLNLTAIPINNSFTAREVREVLHATKPEVLWYQTSYESLAKESISGHSSFNKKARKYMALPTVDFLLSNEESSFADVFEKKFSLSRPWVILHTSGSTSGRKKGCIRNQFGTIAGILVHQNALKLDDTDVFFAVWPSYGISTFFFTFGVLYLGGSVVLIDNRLANDYDESWKLLAREGATFSTGSPLLYEHWIKCAAAASSPTTVPALKVVLVSGSVCDDTLINALCHTFPTSKVFEAYGSTECGLITLRDHRDGFDVSSGGLGFEPPGLPRVRICSTTSEILVLSTSPMFMNGYVHLPGRRGPGWFRTGDVGRRDETSGRIHLLGRADSRINLPNGHDIYPEEVENVLKVVLPVGSTLVVSVVQHQLVGVISGLDANATLAESLHSFALHNLSPNQRPVRYLFVNSAEIPLTTTGKVKRRDLAHAISKL